LHSRATCSLTSCNELVNVISEPSYTNVEIGAAIQRAVEYLLRQRNADGWWYEFNTLAGPSTEWVSAFVALALARSNDPSAFMAAQETWRLLRRSRWSPGWGFNRTVPSDADSTIWALRLAAVLGIRADRRTLRFVSNHITAGGAVRTYANALSIRAYTRLSGISFSGWCGEHACVTAAAAALSQLPERERLITWIRASQRADGRWESYWWSSHHYATALSCEALAAAGGPKDVDRISRATQWTLRDISGRVNTVSPFESALALRTLLLSQKTRITAWSFLKDLTRAQRIDGSWAPSARLRIPPPDVTDPDRYEPWIEGGRGGGSIQLDQNACFTTATVLQALTAMLANRSLRAN
jgi:hypothetical protein